MQNKTTMWYHLTPVRMVSSKNLQTVNGSEDTEKRELSCTVGGNIKTDTATMENSMEILQKTRNKKLPYNPAIPLQGKDPEKNIIEKDTCTPVFTAALFTIARTWKQPRCPSADEWVRKLWYMYTMEYYSAIKRNKFE